MSEAQQLLDRVLKLSEKERAWLAEELLCSLDDELQPGELDVEQMQEIERRLEDYHAGRTKAVGAFKALDEIKRELDLRNP